MTNENNGEDTTGRERLQGLIGEDYRLQWIIGHGGMSTVWLADDMVHEREVAIKVLRPEFSDNREFLDRFRNEAIAAESIDSENVVRTYDFREIPDPAGHTFCFIAMEYVRGESLADLLAREGGLHEALALDVMEQAAHGLAVIHRMGLVHRDIKPGNMMVTQNGQVKITDFGIAKAAAAVPLTRTGMVVGTAQYVSPEQAQGQTVSASSDVYSLGVVGYEMLSGKRPFTGDSSVSVVIAHINQAPPALPTSVSAQARELIGISLRKDPGTRFADGNELALAVAAVRNGSRPPQPKSAAMARRAPEPSPSASTVALGNVAQPTMLGIRAAQGPVVPGQGAPRPVAPAAIAPARPIRGSGGGGFLTGLLIAMGLAAAAAGGIYLAANGAFDRDEETTFPPSPEVVTEYITPTEEQPGTVTSPDWDPVPQPTPTREPSETRETRPDTTQPPTSAPSSTRDVPPPTLETLPSSTAPAPSPGNGTGGNGNGGGGDGDSGAGTTEMPQSAPEVSSPAVSPREPGADNLDRDLPGGLNDMMEGGAL
ncbi:Serine/threonine-protein kinase PknA [Corynebacterium occultum]|uniref:non-specific serine/threonine protein kinase n=1 Tax=Corynebacterium occultum TaxID=2675219 RepID=A0A6B8W515_9CORY|nr:serine/threonine-protein kinase [Corynebacterium occultum]QGU06016.1 Serine/threonine-protein kinase PknA [Corynebacterium occultum]